MGHPFLGPVLVILITWAAWIAGFFLPDVYPFSYDMDLMIGIASALTATAIAIYQILRYRSHYGISLHTGPFPTRPTQVSGTPWFLDLDRWKEESWKKVREPVSLVSGRILFWTGIALALAMGLSALEAVAGIHVDYTDSFRYNSPILAFVTILVVSGWYILRYYRSCVARLAVAAAPLAGQPPQPLAPPVAGRPTRPPYGVNIQTPLLAV